MDFSMIGNELNILASLLTIVTCAIAGVSFLRSTPAMKREMRAAWMRFGLICVCGVATVGAAIFTTSTVSQVPLQLLSSSNGYLVVLASLAWVMAGLALFITFVALQTIRASLQDLEPGRRNHP